MLNINSNMQVIQGWFLSLAFITFYTNEVIQVLDTNLDVMSVYSSWKVVP